GRAAAVAGDVAGRHGDQVGRDAQLGEGAGDPGGAEQVDLDRGVERRVERHGGRRVHDDVAARERGAALVVEAEPVGGDVAGDDGDAATDPSVGPVRPGLRAPAAE